MPAKTKKETKKKGYVQFDPPIKIGDKEFSEIQMREPILSDSLDSEQYSEHELAREAYQIALLCGVNPEDLAKISMPNYKKIQSAFVAFFA